MSLNIEIRKKIVVNGKEYGSLEELPADVRETYRQAVARLGESGGRQLSLSLSMPGPITFNGKEYRDEAAMPPGVRETYRDLMKAVEGGGAATVSRSEMKIDLKRDRPGAALPQPGARPIVPGMSAPFRKILLAAGILLLLFEIALRIFSVR